MENIVIQSRLQSKSVYLTALAFLMVMLLSVAQDYLEASLFEFGFYWSEVFLFNLKWLLFLPVIWLATRCSGQGYWILGCFSLLVAFSYTMTNALLISIISTLLMDYPFEFFPLFKANLSNEIILPLIAFWATVMLRKAKGVTISSTKDLQLKNSLSIRHKGETLIIKDSDINWIGREHQATIIYSQLGKYVYSGSIKKVESQHEKLTRIHRSILVNPDQIDRFRSRNNGEYDVLMRDGTTLRLSRRYRDAILPLIKDSAQPSDYSA